MKLSNNTTSYQTNITSAADFGIEDSDLSHIMGILRSQIYSDKLLAIIREYSTNAVDANIEAGNADNPIHIHLPSTTNSVLSFRDYGNGLTDNEVTSLYVKYGASTKRASNDYTGCLGIGCKAAFAYGDSFQITSYTLAEKTTWLARIDESKRGTISLINREPNHTEPAGVEVAITIRKDDIEECISKANNFFKYWRSDITCNIELPRIETVFKSKDWAIAKSENSSNYHYHRQRSNAKIVMGNIAYPINANDFKESIHGHSLLMHEDVIIYAPLGSLDIAANREALELTDRTKAGITAMANNMMLDLSKMLEDAVKSQPTRIRASMKAKLFDNALGSNLNNKIANNAKWNGLDLIRTIEIKNGCIVHKQEKSWRSTGNVYRNTRAKDVTMLYLTTNVTLCVTDDSISEANSTRRIRTLQAKDNNTNNEYAVIHKNDLNSVTPTLTTADYTDLLTIEPLKPNRTIIPKTDGKKTKQVRINVCTLKPAQLKSNRLTTETKPVANSDGRYVYVPLDRFDWDGRPKALDNLGFIIKGIKHLVDEEITIHGVKKHHVKKLDNNWITLDQYYKEILKMRIRQEPAKYKAEHDLMKLEKVHHHKHWINNRALSKCKANKDVAYIAQSCELSYSDLGIHQTIEVGTFLGVHTNPSKIEDKMNQLNTKYPALKHLYGSYAEDEEVAKVADEYIKLIDKSTNN